MSAQGRERPASHGVTNAANASSASSAALPAGAIFLPPDGGRHYDGGPIHAVFKGDEDETGERFALSEWWLEPHTQGPGAHAHEHNDEIFYVLDGTPSLLIGEEWHDAPKGACAIIPAGIMHDFENRTDSRAGLLNVFIPGGFERDMPAIADWFRENR